MTSAAQRPTSPASPYLTSAEATAYCRFKTSSALRKAYLEGKVRPAGRRGGTGTWMWSVEDLDRFLLGLPPRDTLGGGCPGAPSNGGNHGKHEEGKVETKMEIMDRAQALETRGVAQKGRWISGSRPSCEPENREAVRGQADVGKRRCRRGISSTPGGASEGKGRTGDHVERQRFDDYSVSLLEKKGHGG